MLLDYFFHPKYYETLYEYYYEVAYQFKKYVCEPIYISS